MGKLLKEIREIPLYRGGTRSVIGSYLETLSKEDRDDLLAALNDLEIPAPAIAAALARRNAKVSVDSIQRWRRNRRITSSNGNP